MNKFKYLLFLLVCNSFLNAQQLSILGLTCGYARCQIIGDGYHGLEGESIRGGIFSQLRMSKKTNLQLEIVYSGSGTSGGKKYPYKYYDNLYYLEIPVLYQYHYGSFYAEAGPGAGYLFRESSYEDPLSVVRYFQTRPNPLDLRLNIGIGYQSDKRFGCGLRYNNSIIPIRQQPTTQYNSAFQLLMFYRIISGIKLNN
jgi:hypothetical protein